MLLEELVHVASPEDVGAEAADELERILLAGLGEQTLRQLGHVDALPFGAATEPLGVVVVEMQHQGCHAPDHRSHDAPGPGVVGQFEVAGWSTFERWQACLTQIAKLLD